MIKRARWLHTISAGAAAMLLAACSDSATMPDLRPAYELSDGPPSGMPGTETRNLDPDPNVGCVINGTTCVLGPLGGPVSSPTDIDVIDPCDYDPYACNPSSGGGGGEGGGGGGGGAGPGGGQPGDVDGDNDTLDDGPGAFAICVAANLGGDGWAALVTAGWSVYEAYNLRQSTRTAYDRWSAYIRDYGQLPNYDPALAHLLKGLYEDAQGAENMAYAKATGSSLYLAGKLGIAVATCAPLAPAPTP
jgi:hypothetical protein